MSRYVTIQMAIELRFIARSRALVSAWEFKVLGFWNFGAVDLNRI